MAKAKRKRSRRRRRILVLMLGLALLAVLATGILVGCNAVASAPDVTEINPDASTIFYDRNGNEYYRLFADENRTLVKLNAVPKDVVQAFIAIEDPNFYTNHGIEVRGILRAAVKTGMYMLHIPGGQLQGGSTITQELARTAFLNQDITIKRKLQEAWLAIQLERVYTKDEILEMYLNQVYFGHGAYGIEAAARTFFGKDVSQLDVAEGAQLAGMINGPSYFDPYEHPQDSLDRRDLVLNAMLKQEFIDGAQYDKAVAEKPKLNNTAQVDNKSSWFSDYVVQVLEGAKPGLTEKYGIKLGDIGSVAKAGLKVYTTVDPNLQKLAEQAVADQMSQADKTYARQGIVKQDGSKPEAAMVVMNPKTGEILAMVGGRQHTAALGLNRATDSLRQPGSSIKPLVDYTPMLEAGYSPATILDDAPEMLTTDGKQVWPQNYEFTYQGLVSTRYAVEQSLNPPAVRALQLAGGPAKGLAYGQKFGLSTLDAKNDNNLALALGGLTNGVSVLDMATGYGAIDNMGVKVAPVVITKIVDAHGAVIFQSHPNETVVARASSAYMMIDILKGVIQRGTAYGFTRGFKGWPAAGKTGTTEDNRDGWFVGFTPNMVTAVWNGYDTPSNHLPYTGAYVPVQIWNQFMTQAVTSRPEDWARPSDVVSVQVCRMTGALPNNLCPKDKVGAELFARGTEPKNAGNILVAAKAVQVTVQSADKKTSQTQWQLWQPGCPSIPVDKVFIQRPWPRVKHPTDPFNPKYVPSDAKDELPTVKCEPVPWWQQLFPTPGTPGQQPGQQVPGTQQPGTQPPQSPGTQPPGTQVQPGQQPGTQGQNTNAQPGQTTVPSNPYAPPSQSGSDTQYGTAPPSEND